MTLQATTLPTSQISSLAVAASIAGSISPVGAGLAGGARTRIDQQHGPGVYQRPRQRAGRPARLGHGHRQRRDRLDGRLARWGSASSGPRSASCRPTRSPTRLGYIDAPVTVNHGGVTVTSGSTVTATGLAVATSVAAGVGGVRRQRRPDHFHDRRHGPGIRRGVGHADGAVHQQRPDPGPVESERPGQCQGGVVQLWHRGRNRHEPGYRDHQRHHTGVHERHPERREQPDRRGGQLKYRRHRHLRAGRGDRGRTGGGGGTVNIDPTVKAYVDGAVGTTASPLSGDVTVRSIVDTSSNASAEGVSFVIFGIAVGTRSPRTTSIPR